MNLTSFTDVDVKNEDSMREFLDYNALNHETIYNALLTSSQITIEHYPLWTMAGVDKDWLLIHDSEHKAIANALSLPIPVDLDSLEVNDKQQSDDWLNNHAQAHGLIAQAMGL